MDADLHTPAARFMSPPTICCPRLGQTPVASPAALLDQAGALGLSAPEGRHRQLAVKADHERTVEGHAQRVGRDRARAPGHPPRCPSGRSAIAVHQTALMKASWTGARTARGVGGLPRNGMPLRAA